MASTWCGDRKCQRSHYVPDSYPHWVSGHYYDPRRGLGAVRLSPTEKRLIGQGVRTEEGHEGQVWSLAEGPWIWVATGREFVLANPKTLEFL